MFTQKMKTILGLQKLNPIIWLATSPPFQTMDQKIRICSKKFVFFVLEAVHYKCIQPKTPCQSNWTRIKLFKPYQCNKTAMPLHSDYSKKMDDIFE